MHEGKFLPLGPRCVVVGGVNCLLVLCLLFVCVVFVATPQLLKQWRVTLLRFQLHAGLEDNTSVDNAYLTTTCKQYEDQEAENL